MVVFSGRRDRPRRRRAQVRGRSHAREELSFTAALRHLRGEHGVRLALCEGGPAVLGALLRERVLDQLCLSLAGKLAGGGTAPASPRAPRCPQPGRRPARGGARARRDAFSALRGYETESVRRSRACRCHNEVVVDGCARSRGRAGAAPAEAREPSPRWLRPAGGPSRWSRRSPTHDLERVHSDADEPARLGSRPHRRLRGPVDRSPARRPAACSARAWPRSTTRSRRRASGRGELPFLRPGARRREYLAEVRERSLEVIAERGLGDGHGGDGAAPRAAAHRDDAADAAARPPGRLPPPGDPARNGRPGRRRRPSATGGLELVEVPAVRARLGAGSRRLCLRQRASPAPHRRPWLPDRPHADHQRHLPHLRGRRWVRASRVVVRRGVVLEGGLRHHTTRGLDAGPRRRSGGCSQLEPLHPDRPVVHISWFEADAFARAHGLRLPTEAEWEKAATWDQEQQRALPHPWGDTPPVRGVHANLDQLARGTVPSPALTAGASPYGCLAMIGDVWEWTQASLTATRASPPSPTPSTPRCSSPPATGSCAAAPGRRARRVATATFRNWDLPQRRQIFAGLRVAKDL